MSSLSTVVPRSIEVHTTQQCPADTPEEVSGNTPPNEGETTPTVPVPVDDDCSTEESSDIEDDQGRNQAEAPLEDTCVHAQGFAKALEGANGGKPVTILDYIHIVTGGKDPAEASVEEVKQWCRVPKREKRRLANAAAIAEGLYLSAEKQRARHGMWGKWVKKTYGWSADTVENRRKVAKYVSENPIGIGFLDYRWSELVEKAFGADPKSRRGRKPTPQNDDECSPADATTTDEPVDDKNIVTTDGDDCNGPANDTDAPVPPTPSCTRMTADKLISHVRAVFQRAEAAYADSGDAGEPDFSEEQRFLRFLAVSTLTRLHQVDYLVANHSELVADLPGYEPSRVSSAYKGAIEEEIDRLLETDLVENCLTALLQETPVVDPRKLRMEGSD